jgi:hypothetical protein
MDSKYGANKYYEINGQQCRPFILNIEAFARIANDPVSFNGEDFYKEWTERYFGEASTYAINAMKMLHKAHFGNSGYISRLAETKAAISYLRQSPVSSPGNTVPEHYTRVAANFEPVEQRKDILEGALIEANEGAAVVNKNRDFYHDYVVLPIVLYLDILNFEWHLHNMVKLKYAFEKPGNRDQLHELQSMVPVARGKLQTIIDRRFQGDKNTKWAGWYDVSRRRPNGSFPSMEMLDEIEKNLERIGIDDIINEE